MVARRQTWRQRTLAFAFAMAGSAALTVRGQSIRFPLDGDWIVSEGFATAYIAGKCGFHLGEDVPASPGTAVRAVADGTVKFQKDINGLGHAVQIEHELADGSKFVAVYYHLRRIGEGGIDLPATVGRGDVIGFVTERPEDRGTSPHLHFGIRPGPFQPGDDARTGKWFYPGYTAIYVAPDVRQCGIIGLDADQIDPKHAAIVSQWESPRAFLKAHGAPFLEFVEGDPGIPGDGIFISQDGGSFPSAFELLTPFALAGASDGITVTTFSPTPPVPGFSDFGIIIQSVNLPAQCIAGSGLMGYPAEPVIVNGVAGAIHNFLQEQLQGIVDAYNQFRPSGCPSISLSDLYVIGLDRSSPPDDSVLDAAAIGFGQNAVPVP